MSEYKSLIMYTLVFVLYVFNNDNFIPNIHNDHACILKSQSISHSPVSGIFLFYNIVLLCFFHGFVLYTVVIIFIMTEIIFNAMTEPQMGLFQLSFSSMVAV